MKLEFRNGAAVAVLGFLWICGEYAAGLHGARIELHPWVSPLFLVVPAGAIALTLLQGRNEAGVAGYSWLAGLRSGLLVSLFAAVGGTLGQIAFHQWVNPGFFDAMIAHAVEHGRATPADAQAWFNLESYLKQSLVGTLALGAAVSAVAALVLRRPPAA